MHHCNNHTAFYTMLRYLLLNAVFFTSLLTHSVYASQFTTDGIRYKTLQQALDAAVDGSIVEIDAGKYKQASVLKANNVTITGVAGKTAIHDKTVEGKGALVIKGDNTTISNLECFNINVSHQNGACIRLEGRNLDLHNVYFHDSQQGLLTGGRPGTVSIYNSRFERLGKGGQAHGIYLGGGRLFITDSYFLSSKSEGHEIKSRASENIITKSVIASLDGKDSRLIDIPFGGILKVTDSVLQQGDKTSNWNLIGFAMEGYKRKTNMITLRGNIFLLDRRKGNKVLDIKNSKTKPVVAGNAFIGNLKDKNFDDSNYFFDDREEAKLDPYPYLPPLP